MSNNQNLGLTIQFELDGQQVEARAGETIWQVAKRQGTEIPHLCYSPAPGCRPGGSCRARPPGFSGRPKGLPVSRRDPARRNVRREWGFGPVALEL